MHIHGPDIPRRGYCRDALLKTLDRGNTLLKLLHGRENIPDSIYTCHNLVDGRNKTSHRRHGCSLHGHPRAVTKVLTNGMDALRCWLRSSAVDAAKQPQRCTADAHSHRLHSGLCRLSHLLCRRAGAWGAMRFALGGICG